MLFKRPRSISCLVIWWRLSVEDLHSVLWLWLRVSKYGWIALSTGFLYSIHSYHIVLVLVRTRTSYSYCMCFTRNVVVLCSLNRLPNDFQLLIDSIWSFLDNLNVLIDWRWFMCCMICYGYVYEFTIVEDILMLIQSINGTICTNIITITIYFHYFTFKLTLFICSFFKLFCIIYFWIYIFVTFNKKTYSWVYIIY